MNIGIFGDSFEDRYREKELDDEQEHEPEYKTYKVRWEIEVECTSPKQAAEEARRIQQDPDNEANFYDVFDEHGLIETFEIKES